MSEKMYFNEVQVKSAIEYGDKIIGLFEGENKFVVALSLASVIESFKQLTGIDVSTAKFGKEKGELIL